MKHKLNETKKNQIVLSSIPVPNLYEKERLYPYMTMFKGNSRPTPKR